MHSHLHDTYLYLKLISNVLWVSMHSVDLVLYLVHCRIAGAEKKQVLMEVELVLRDCPCYIEDCCLALLLLDSLSVI